MATNIFESNDPQHGERATEIHHRRIEVQSPKDLTYVIGKVSRDAREKIDRDLPPDAVPDGGEDMMRKRVEELVDDVRWSPTPIHDLLWRMFKC